MPREIQKPVVTRDRSPMGGERINHPAYAMIGAHRGSYGGADAGTTLFGSDFRHGSTIMLRIFACEDHRTLSRNWPHATRLPLIEVEMSEAQWATFVSSLNVGDGVPCTLRSVGGEQKPGLPAPVSPAATFSKEAGEATMEAVAALRTAIAEAELRKTPQKHIEPLRRALRKLEDSLPFVAKSFSKHMEAGVEKAKVEIHGYLAGVLQRAGVLSLSEAAPPLAIDYQPDDASEPEDDDTPAPEDDE